jgi:hypothetical protein
LAERAGGLPLHRRWAGGARSPGCATGEV